MACQTLVELTTDYLESALPEDDCARFEQHIEECQGCENYLDQIRQTIQFCARLREEPMPVASTQKLLQQFQTWKRR